jgi:hypothetical protein
MMESPRPQKLLDQVRDAIRLKHYSYRTEETYVYWIRPLFASSRSQPGLWSGLFALCARA